MKSRECGWAKAVDDKLRMGKGIEEEEEFLSRVRVIAP